MGALADRIIDKVRTVNASCRNHDKFVASCAPLGKNSAKIVIGSTNPIDLSTARDFIFSITGHTLIPCNETFTAYVNNHSDIHYASMIAYRTTEMQVSEDDPRAQAFVQVNANTYLDQNIGSVWEKSIVEGKPYYVRQNDDDVETLLKTFNLTASVSENLAIDAFSPDLSKGVNVVEFFVHDKFGKTGVEHGIVKAVAEATVSVQVGEHLVTIPTLAVTKVVSVEGASSISEVIDYLKKAYNPSDGSIDYAKMFKDKGAE